MDYLKPILLSLALVFGAIGIFEVGARYGASNVRAIAVAAQLQTFLNFYAQTAKDSDTASVDKIERIIDHHIATASIQRDHWLLKLKAEPRATLDKTLRNGLEVRGGEVLEHISASGTSIDKISVSPEQFEQIRAAVEKAKRELVGSE